MSIQGARAASSIGRKPKHNLSNFTKNLIPSQIKITEDMKHMNTNLKENYGFGNYLRKQKPDHAIRIWLQNINGLRLSTGQEKLISTLETMKELQIDVLATPEINSPWTRSLYDRCRQLGNQINGSFKCIGTSSDEPSTGKYQPGGVGLFARDRIVGRINKADVDKRGLGRWCYFRLSGQYKKYFWIIAGYRVCQQHQAGSETAYSQQVRIMRRNGIDNPQPRQQWNTDMTKFLNTIPSEDEILLLVDANGTMDDDDIGQLCADTNLYNLMISRHGTETPATYIRGTKTIDLALGTAGVVKALEEIGYIEFLKYFTADHRGLFIDLFKCQLFSGLLHPLQQRDARKVQLRAPHRVNKYVEKATINITEARIMEKLKDIEEATKEMQKCLVHQHLDQINEDFHQSLLKASDSLAPYPIHWWTLTVKRCYQIIKYWEATLSFQKCKVSGEEILEEMRSNIDESVDIFQGDKDRSVAGQLRQARKALRKARSDSFKDRESMQWAEAAKKVKEKDDAKRIAKTKRIVASMKRTEKRMGMFTKMKSYLQKNNQAALTHVDVPCEPSLWKWLLPIWYIKLRNKYSKEWIVLWSINVTITGWPEIVQRFGTFGPHKRIVEKEHMDEHLYQQHKKHFRQAQGTPFTVEPLRSLFGTHLETQFAQDFVEGNINIDDIDGINDMTKTFLKELVPKPTDPPQIDINITSAQIEQGFKIWTEKTSTSPHGNHLGLYKAWIRKHDDENILPKECFFSILQRLTTLSITHCHPFSQWKKVHNLYLCKKPGNYKIHRLRTIHIVDAVLNLLRREYITRRLMKHAEQHQYLTDNQHGGRAGRAAIDVPLLKTFTLETFYLIRANAAFTDCDARACYDRMVAILTGLVQYKMGLPLILCMYFIKALKQMVYHMSTAYGLSSKTNAHTEEDPVHGDGQGATSAPPDWSGTSHVGLTVYSEKAKGCLIADPTRTIQQKRDADMFVDDQTSQHNGGRYNATETQLMQMVHHDINLWDSILYTAGGMLESLKSSYSLLVWEFDDNGTPSVKQERDMASNQVFLQREGSNLELKRTNETEGIKMLGVHKALTLQEVSSLKHITEKTKRFTTAINSCPIPRSEILAAYFTIFIPSVSYIFPATTFTETELVELHRILLPKLLPRAGYRYNFPHSVAMAPKKYLGVGLTHLKGLHLALQIEALMRHVRAKTSVGNTANIMIRWAQLAAGISKPILEDTGRLTYLEGCWVNNVRDGLITINASLRLTTPWLIHPQREKDVHLMEIIRQDWTLNDTILRFLNQCRMFLGIDLLSDITTSDGTKLIPQVYTQKDGERLDNQRIEIDWPRQPAPNRKIWQLWNTTILRLLCYHNGRLKHPLGRWTRITKHWRRYYDPHNNRVYSYTENGWTIHDKVTVTRRIIQYHKQHHSGRLPRKLTPLTDITAQENSPYFIGSSPSTIKYVLEPQPPATFREYIDQLPRWERVLLRFFTEVNNNFASLDVHLQLGTELWFVTDGGATGPLGYYGWLIATETIILWEGYGHSQGNPDLMESLRTESSGLLSLGRLIYHRTNYLSIKLNSPINLHYCDNSTFQKRMAKYFHGDKKIPTSYLLADMDVQMQIEATFNDLHISVTSHHVKGHQDRPAKPSSKPPRSTSEAEEKARIQKEEQKKKKKKKLSWQAQLNIRADQLATTACEILYNTSAQDQFDMLPAAEIYLFINDKPITRNIKSAVNDAWATQDLRKHLKEKFQWKGGTADLIDWYACGRVHENQRNPEFRRFVTRYTHERLEVNNASFNIAAPSKHCPYCTTTMETSPHFLLCVNNEERWEDLTFNLGSIYNKYNIDPALRIILNTALCDGDIKATQQHHPLIRWRRYKRLVQTQEEIGWRQLKYGRFSSHWHSLQQQYETQLFGSTDQGAPKWLRKIIQMIWKFAHTRWLARCKKQFGTGAQAYGIQQEALYQRIMNLYQQQHDLLQQDRHPFRNDLSYWKTAPVTQMRRWLLVHQPFIHHCLSIAKKQTTLQTTDIRNFFPGLNPTKETTRRKPRRRRRRTSQHSTSQDIRRFMHQDPRPPKRPTQRPSQIHTDPTEYFSTQDKPPDTTQLVQRRLDEFF